MPARGLRSALDVRGGQISQPKRGGSEADTAVSDDVFFMRRLLVISSPHRTVGAAPPVRRQCHR